jgi:hypothetical protein
MCKHPKTGRAPPETSGGTGFTLKLFSKIGPEFNGAPLVNYADSQSEMEQGKARHDVHVVEAAARALLIAEAVARIFFL